MTTRQTRNSHLFQRSSGERAFDCILISNILVFIVAGSIRALLFDSGSENPSLQYSYLALGFGVAAFTLWLWLLRGVVRAWHDPYACILRYNSLSLLALAALMILGLLRGLF